MSNRKNYKKLDEILSKKNTLKIGQKTLEEKLECAKFENVLNYCLNSLSFDYQEIMSKTYLNSNFKFWWVDKYSKSTFYRKKENAVNSFVQLFEMIYENYFCFSNNIKRSI